MNEKPVDPDIIDDEPEGEAEDQGPRVPRGVFGASDQPDLSRYKVPQLRVAQGMTQEVTDRKANVGDFVLSNFPACKEVTVIPFGMVSVRSYKTDPKKPAVCYSPNGVTGFGTPGGTCADCKFAKWTAPRPGSDQNTPPACKEGLLMRAYSITHKTLVDLAMMGSMIRAGDFIIQQSFSNGWNSFAISLSTSSKSNNKGTWFVPNVEMVDSSQVTPEDRELANKWWPIYEALREQALQTYLALPVVTP